MKMCQEFKALPERGGFLDQPADVMVRWHDYMVAEGEALDMRRRIEEAQAKGRRN